MEVSSMLVLSRKVGESIYINESIRVTVVHAENGRIRLGINAPPEVKVLREELTRAGANSSPNKNDKAEWLELPDHTAQVQPVKDSSEAAGKSSTNR
jgi:carbon storage regulator